MQNRSNSGNSSTELRGPITVGQPNRMMIRKTISLMSCAAALGASLLTCQADTWVTVDADGNVSRTEVESKDTPTRPSTTPQSSPQTSARPTVSRQSQPDSDRPNSNAATTAGATTAAATSASAFGEQKSMIRVDTVHGTYYVERPSQPSHPHSYPYDYGQYFYYPPVVPYSGPLAPAPYYGNPAWITSIPLGQPYYYPYPCPPAYAPRYPVCHVCGYNPCACYSIAYRAHMRGTYGRFSIGSGGLNITIGRGRR